MTTERKSDGVPVEILSDTRQSADEDPAGHFDKKATLKQRFMTFIIDQVNPKFKALNRPFFIASLIGIATYAVVTAFFFYQINQCTWQTSLFTTYYNMDKFIRENTPTVQYIDSLVSATPEKPFPHFSGCVPLDFNDKPVAKCRTGDLTWAEGPPGQTFPWCTAPVMNQFSSSEGTRPAPIEMGTPAADQEAPLDGVKDYDTEKSFSISWNDCPPTSVTLGASLGCAPALESGAAGGCVGTRGRAPRPRSGDIDSAHAAPTQRPRSAHAAPTQRTLKAHPRKRSGRVRVPRTPFASDRHLTARPPLSPPSPPPLPPPERLQLRRPFRDGPHSGLHPAAHGPRHPQARQRLHEGVDRRGYHRLRRRHWCAPCSRSTRNLMSHVLSHAGLC